MGCLLFSPDSAHKLTGMNSTSVRIRPATRKALAELAQATRSSPQKVLDSAVESYRRHVFLKGANQAYARLRKNSKAWADYRTELATWERLSGDGL